MRVKFQLLVLFLTIVPLALASAEDRGAPKAKAPTEEMVVGLKAKGEADLKKVTPAFLKDLKKKEGIKSAKFDVKTQTLTVKYISPLTPEAIKEVISASEVVQYTELAGDAPAGVGLEAEPAAPPPDGPAKPAPAPSHP